MNKIHTINQAQDFLDNEFSWRLKEISDINISVRRAKLLRQKTLIRAGITMLYAHWEGFIKISSEAYINYVSNQKLIYKNLETCFIVRGLKKELNQLAGSNKYYLNIRTVDFLLSELGGRASIPYSGVVRTNSNLSSIVFKNIANSIGIDVSIYEPRFRFIDERILERRNKIAHGEYLDIDGDSFDELSKGVIGLLRQYKTDLENSLVLNSHIR